MFDVSGYLSTRLYALLSAAGITLGAQGVKIGWSTARAPQQPREGGRGGGGYAI